VIGEPYWMDAALLAEAGIDTVVFGPSGGGAHAAEEWVELDTVEDVAAILARAATDFCAPMS
jgi:acetylornithine deacetylase